jgi:hypothetical protein
VGSQDPAFGDFVLTHMNILNEVGDPGDIAGALPDVYFGAVTDWDISGSDNVYNYNDLENQNKKIRIKAKVSELKYDTITVFESTKLISINKIDGKTYWTK